MKAIAWALKALLVIALLVLWGCAKQGMSVSDYHDIVIQTLNKSQPQPSDSSTEASSFAAMVSLLIGDMDCMGDTCINALRFSHLKDLADQDRFEIANYRGQLCDGKKLQPPSQEAKAHQEICNALEQIFHEVDAIMTTSALALQLLGNDPNATKSAGVQVALEGAANNLTHNRENIRATLISLQDIPWLKPALPSLP